MDIDSATLLAQYKRAKAQWSFIHGYEGHEGLPDSSLYAVGSRETNLTNEIGDNGHGHGIWQEDDRANEIPQGFDNSPAMQCQTASKSLGGLFKQLGNIICAYDAYNAGLSNEQAGEQHGNPDCYTTGHDYGHDCFQRQSTIHAQHIKDTKR